MLVWVDKQDVVLVAAIQREVVQAVALDEGCHGAGEEVWADECACSSIFTTPRVDIE